jgi:hypothetical protein
MHKNMKNRFTPYFVSALSVGAVALLCQNAQSQSLVYSDTATYTGDNFNFDTGQTGLESAGNEIVLAAANDVITSFSVQIDFTGSGTPTGTVDVQFLQNTGNPYNGYATPNAGGAGVIWDSTYSTLGSFSSAAGEVLTYSLPNVTVPKDFTFVVNFDGLTSTEVAGLSIYGNTTVGANYNDAWVNTGSGWELQKATGSDPAPQFGASLTAIPEPSTIALGVMGACAFLARRRKS